MRSNFGKRGCRTFQHIWLLPVGLARFGQEKRSLTSWIMHVMNFIRWARNKAYGIRRYISMSMFGATPGHKHMCIPNLM